MEPGTAVACLAVRDLAEAVEFYRDALGLAVRAVLESSAPRLALLDANGVPLVLQEAPGQSGPGGPRPVPLVGPWAAAVLVPDLDRLHGHLRTHGADLLGEPVPAFGTRLLELLDASGNLICLVEGSPGQFGVGPQNRAGRLTGALAAATDAAVQVRSMNREKIRSLRTRARERDFRLFYDGLRDREGIYYMFFTSGLLHWVVAAESHVPAGTNLVLIGSALTDEERTWIAARLERPFHHVEERIDDIAAWQLLFAVNRHDFGWLDVDCFVLNPHLFAEMADVDPHVSMNCTWSMASDVGPPIAGTHFLFLNRSTIDAVRAAGVPADPGTFDWAGSARPRPQLGHNRVPGRRVRELLLSVLPDHGGRPAFVSGAFYDTLMVYQLLAHALGRPIHRVRQLARRCSLPTDADSVDHSHWPEDVSEELFHLCGISYYQRFSDNPGILVLYLAAELTMLDGFLLGDEPPPPRHYRDERRRIMAELTTRGCPSAEMARNRFRRHLVESRGLSTEAAERVLGPGTAAPAAAAARVGTSGPDTRLPQHDHL